MNTESLLDIVRSPVDDVIKGLKSKSDSESKNAGLQLSKTAAKYGLGLRDYLTLAVKADEGLTGYEQCLAALNLPIRNDISNGVLLQAASETFQTFPGTRALFPEVIDDILRWANRQEMFETVGPMIATSRPMNGNELLSTVVNDDSGERDSFSVAEQGRIPVRSIRTSQTAVKMWKHGSGIRTTYEFNRRASLDLLVPFANRVARELERSKVTAAYSVLVNGDGVNAAANVVAQSGYNTPAGSTATNGVLSWEHLLYWLVLRAKAGVPVDTIIGNWDSAYKWAKLWAVAGTNTAASADNMNVVLGKLSGQNGLKLPMPSFVVASVASANQLMGITKSETLEELVESGANIEESERSIQNQTITMVKSEVTGYKLAFADTREIFNYGG